MQPSPSLNPVSRLSARATFRDLTNGVVLMRMTGPLTVEVISEFCGRLNARSGHAAVGWIFDYRAAVLMATEADLERLVQTSHPDRRRRPGAFIVSGDYVRVFQGQALRMARLGFKRRCFDTVERAHEWVLWAARP